MSLERKAEVRWCRFTCYSEDFGFYFVRGGTLFNEFEWESDII